MTKPRSTLVSLTDTPWYHVVCRCVRRAYLCGEDAHTGVSYAHRRDWIVERVKQLAGVFAVDVAAYAVMSNHYHLVLRIDAERAQGWSREEVLRRWTQLYDGPPLVRHLLAGQDEGLDAAVLATIDEWTATYRTRLGDLSWFMRVLNETIARRANAEDQVTGRFWEGRFKSQALLDEQAILTAMAYVDLNPIRANMAATPEASEYTSVAERMAALVPGAEGRKSSKPARSMANEAAPEASTAPLPAVPYKADLAQLPRQPLMPFDATARQGAAIPFSFEDYLDLVETTGRCLRPDKRGSITEDVPKLLQRLAIDPGQFIDCATELMSRFGSAIGAPGQLTELCVQRQVKYLRGIQAARGAFGRQTA
ncbi:MAG: transposase [Gammaproteobacteria bacterium]|nr:transposase [Gammaproteobacteria bacterium]